MTGYTCNRLRFCIATTRPAALVIENFTEFGSCFSPTSGHRLNVSAQSWRRTRSFSKLEGRRRKPNAERLS